MSETVGKLLGRRVRRIRQDKGLTLKQIEAKVGVSATHISEIERGKTSPTIQAVRNLPADTLLISNQPTAILFLTGRLTFDMVSTLWTAGMNKPGILYGDNGTDPNQVRFRDEHAALVVFNYGMPTQLQAENEENTRTLWDLTHGLFEYAHLEDGQIFFYSP